MSNSVTERIPYDWFEIDAIEGWLDEHVRQGLRLVNITPLKRAEFEPATGSLTRYRIHVKEEKDGSRDEEYHETFRELGWEFVAELNDQADIYQAIRPDAVEINTDEEVLRSVIDRVVRNRRILIAVYIPFILYWCYQQFTQFSGYLEQGVYSFLIHEVILVPLVLGLFSAWITLLVAAIRNLRKIKHRRLLDRDFHTTAEYKRRKRQNRSVVLIYGTVLALCFLGLLFFDGNNRFHFPTPPCPVADLSEVNAEEFAQIPYYRSHDSRGNYLLSTFYHYSRDGETIHMENNRVYTPFSYSVGVHKIHIEAWAVPYLHETLAHYDEPWQQVDISGWDEAWYQLYNRDFVHDLPLGENDPIPPDTGHRLYLLDGNTIIHVSYDGATDLYPRLQELYGR